MKYLYPVALLIAFCSVIAEEKPTGIGPIPTSMVELLVNPQSFNGKKIQVKGVLSWGFEDQFLFLTHEHFEAWDAQSAISLFLDEKSSDLKSRDLDAYRGCWVLLEGEFGELQYGVPALDAARKAGLTGKQHYGLQITRMVPYGRPSRTVPVQNQSSQPTPPKGG